MIKKSVSFILCLSFLLSLVTVYTPVAYAVDGGLDIYSEDGRRVDSVELEYNEKVSLTAASESFALTECRWQILYGGRGGIWVDIYDMDSPSCEISRAVVENMQNGDGVSYIRCMAEYDGEVYYSDAVEVTVGEPDLDLDPPHVTSYVSMPEMTADEEAVQVKKRYYLDSRAAEAEYVTVTIKYLDSASLSGDEASIYSPYVATIEKGSSFSQTVISPTFIGFAPYYDSIPDDGDDTLDDDASSITLNYPAVNENIEIKVYYKPIKVDFAIKYFFQNINDDLYTEDVSRYHSGKEETGTIISDTYIIEHAGDTTGFEKMYHIPESVAADGSTVFECYYDRKYYLIQFDLNGGYGVEPIYARYGTPFIVNNPIRHGYNFTGWKLIAVDTNGNGKWDEDLPDGVSSGLVSTIPSYNYYYQAQWETVDTTYTVVYWLDDNYIGSRIVSEKSGEYVSGSNDLATAQVCGLAQHTHSDANGCYGNCTSTSTTHTHSEDCLSCRDEVHTHGNACKIDTTYFVYERADSNVLVEGDGSTVVNVYYKPKEYTLRFYYAATTGTGVDGDSDGIAETYDSVKIIGGSTYSFGASGTNTSNDATLLNNIFESNQAGTVTKLPQLNATGKARNYTQGTLVSGATSYHYIEFTAGYGEDISDLWPCSVFESATRTSITNNTNGWTGDQAFVSAWNGEHHVWYSQSPPDGSSNQTIKGKYEKLDKILLFHPNYTDEPTVSYLCFWENGAGNVNWNVPELYVYRIWVPVLPGEVDGSSATTTVDGLPIMVENGITYKLIDSYDTCDDSEIKQQTQPSLEGYIASHRTGEEISLTAEQKKNYIRGYNVNFFYSRQEDNPFAMKNHGDYIVNIKPDNSGKGGVPYGTKISTLSELDVLQDDFNPVYPTTLEENAYYFEGWYTTEQCIPGTKIDLSSLTMPASGLILYANWMPETHTARFFTTYDEMISYENGTSSTMHYSEDVEHGTVVGSVENPVLIDQSNMQLIFAGWFYIENGQKKAFSPLDMQINRDINLFADWSSSQPQPYRIDYRLLTQRDTAVAEPSTGFAYGGSTRTFVAKAGNPYNQLYPAYNSGYFPTVGSHSITIQYEEDKNSPQNNVYNFYYVQAQNIEYTIRYVNKENNTLIGEEVVKITGDAVVTERFKPIENMVPDAFYKRLVISVKQDEHGDYVGTEDNVITFYYTPNETSAYYAVHFMLENIHDPGNSSDVEGNYKVDGTGGYTSTGTHLEGIGDVGKNVSITPQSFPGFTIIKKDAAQLVTGGNITGATKVDINSNGDFPITVYTQGSELYLFYKRNEYNYTVHHYIYNTTEPVSPSEAPDETGIAPYGSLIEASAKKVTGYTCVSAELTDTIEIKDKPEQNVIIFYYSPLQYVAEYVAVPPEGGWLSSTIEVIAGRDSLSGSVPTPDKYYEFGGWFIDEACTVSASDYGTVDEATGGFVPRKEKLSETERNIFYAKFNSRSGDLTVSRSGAEDDGQVFVYEIKNDATGDTIYLTVIGKGSATVKDLVFGEYTVTQQNGWSWRYSDTAFAVSHSNVNGTTVPFGNSVSNEKWLNGNSAPATNVRGNG